MARDRWQMTRQTGRIVEALKTMYVMPHNVQPEVVRYLDGSARVEWWVGQLAGWVMRVRADGTVERTDYWMQEILSRTDITEHVRAWIEKWQGSKKETQ